jgi:hypothetical protein
MIREENSLQRTASWVIRNKMTKQVVMETFEPAHVAALNTAKYEAVPILAYLGELNRAVRIARKAELRSYRGFDR